MEKKENKASKKNKVKKTKSYASAKDAKIMRQIISINWKTIDARLNNIWKARSGDTSFLYEAILLPLTLRYAKWYSVDIRGTLRNSHKVGCWNNRSNTKSKRRKMVGRINGKTTSSSQSRPLILPESVSGTRTNVKLPKNFGKFKGE
jgi:hypothetical protein